MTSNRLLIIDDDPEITTFVETVALSCGFEVKTTHRADEFRNLHTIWRPTLIVLDLQMPGTDGIELIRFLAIERSVAQILIMSGFNSRVLASAKTLGVERGLTIVGTLPKPMQVADLRNRLNKLRIDAGADDNAAS